MAEEGAAESDLGRIQQGNWFEGLAKTEKSFKSAANAGGEEGPVQFERDKDAPFGIHSLIGQVTGKGDAEKRNCGLEQAKTRSRKRARADDD